MKALSRWLYMRLWRAELMRVARYCRNKEQDPNQVLGALDTLGTLDLLA